MDVLFDDIEIMKRIAAQDEHAFRALYQQYGKAVYSLAYRVVQNTTLAEEITQDTFLKVWHHKTGWDPDRGKLKNWLLTITHFTAIDHLRREKRQPNLHPEPIEEIEEEIALLHQDNFWQEGAAIRMLLTQLTDDQAHLIQLAFFQGMSHSEIASRLQIPLGTVKTRLRTGLQRLRELWLESFKQKS